jgi:cellobiose phosphorylase
MTKNIRPATYCRSSAPGQRLSSDLVHPQLALLSNGQYSVIVTAAGGGASTWRGLDVTRWREDLTRDCWGQFCYVRDLADNKVWSVGYQPLCRAANENEIKFQAHTAEFRRLDSGIDTRLAVCVAPDVNAEVRAVTIVNHGARPRDLELTSYAEVCLNNRRADQAHPAFAKLFLETQFDKPTGALLARRRPRGANEKPVWAVHVSSSNVTASGAIAYETDRVRFLGRGRTPANPAATDPGAFLSETTGPVLDPIFSLRRRVRLDPGETASIAFITGATDTREEAMAISEKFQNFCVVDRVFSAALAESEKECQELSLTPYEIDLFNRLAGAVVFTNSGLRQLDAIATNRLGQPGLWPHAISGDLPIVLIRVAEAADESLVRELTKWHAYVRRRGLESDFVVLDERDGHNADRLKDDLQAGAYGALLGKPGGLFVMAAANVSADHAMLIAAAARVVLGGGQGSLADQLDGQSDAASFPPPLLTTRPIKPEPTAPPTPRISDLIFWNGSGGFSPDGREYVIVVDCATAATPALPPAPWTNVIANPNFGCLVTEGGLGYTWAGNSQMNRLTPWSNDPASDPPGEVVYLRDEETGEVWTPTPLPMGHRSVVTIRHGLGYTRYTNHSRELQQDLSIFVPLNDPIKVICLKLRNSGNRPRNLSATYYAEWVLGSAREHAPMQVICKRDVESGAILAQSAWAGDFAGKLAFTAASQSVRSATADRTEFIGRNGTLSAPAALERVDLAGRYGPSLDPCGALMTGITLAPGQETDVIFVVGQADSLVRVRDLVREYTNPARAKTELAEVCRHWDGILEAIQVSTPDVGLNLMLNRWLLYQVLACRIWARSAFYQSGGAYGFRDQLQDVMALVYSATTEARDHILRSAARQFEEGDVQHWWHPPSGLGVRTRITDDLYFLPLAVHHYVTTTGDVELLDAVVPFIKSPLLRGDQEEDFNLPSVSEQSGTVYEHCVRALELGYRLGVHGLPLMGTGDWNDGMNNVGAEGKGESVWNGWFFLTVLKEFAGVAKRRGDKSRAAWCQERAEALRVALEANAWDGAWYRRAYFDDGTPLGSAQNDECQIDAIPQAWALISGAANAERTGLAMDAVQNRLVRPNDKLIQLFEPPFDKGLLQPGYIKGYVPGIRENGGQYTHAATWVVLATALQGHGDRALELWNLINPVYHATTPAEVQHYKVEPYVVCADVYGAPPHTGRGGWTWYTGSASWLYRVALEAILGFRQKGNTLQFEPCIPPGWVSYELMYRYGTASYQIRVDNSAGTGRGVRSVLLDGQSARGNVVSLCDDGQKHEVLVKLGYGG